MNDIRKAFFADLAASVDPVTFARSLGIDPDSWQRDLLLSADPRIILNCARQSGKSTITAVLALHHALNNFASLVLILSPSQRQSSELFKKVMGFYVDLGRPIVSETETALTLQLTNKSRIVSLPGKEKTVRGYSGVSLLIIDEAAQVDDDLYYSVRPMLAVSQGRLILLSTPFGRRGFFFKEWSESKAWKKIKITAWECPRIAPEFLEEERLAFGEWWFRQEFECEFSENLNSVFTYDEIMGAFDDDVKPLFDKNGGLNL
ncbi:MAG: terminase family protein [Halobacteriota archaeon]|jgi:hypothetical protein